MTEQVSIQDALKNTTDTELLDSIIETLGHRSAVRRQLAACLAEQTEKEKPPYLRVEKASADFKPIVKWLVERSRTEKVTAVLSHRLLTLESDLRQDGHYDGSIGNDLLRDWENETDQIVAEQFAAQGDAVVAAFTAALICCPG